MSQTTSRQTDHADASAASACSVAKEAVDEWQPLPNLEHERFVSGLTGQPDSFLVINAAVTEIQKRLVEYGWPKNTMIHGLVWDQLWRIYVAGDRRGVARESHPASALYPVG